jgi:dTDP-4-amino-4,6-dideoxygalactose transaminase
MSRAPDGPWYYEQQLLGFNYRMTDLQAALGLSQAARLDEYVARRHALAARYDALLADLPLTCPWQHPDSYSGLHLYVIRVQDDQDGECRRRVFDGLRARDIGVNVHYIPVHTQPYYRAMGFAPGDFPVAEAYYAEAISLPMYPTLSEAEQDRVVAALREALDDAGNDAAGGAANP